MANVALVQSVSKQKLKDDQVTDDDLKKGLKPIMDIPGGAADLDHNYMFAILARRVNGLLTTDMDITTSSRDLVRNVWDRLKPYTPLVQEVHDTLAETMDDLEMLAGGESAQQDSAEPGTANAYNAQMPLGRPAVFDPFNPRLADIPHAMLGDRVAVHVQILVSTFVCDMILKDDAFKNSTVQFVKCIVEFLSYEMQMNMVPQAYASICLEMLVSLRQIIFLDDLANERVTDTYQDRYA
eukprot:6857682-Pyramimonas_sp.AAC.1